jgi:protein O-mannosyl-transferase
MALDKQLIPRKKFLRPLLCCGIIAVITFIAFLPSLDNGFTNWDDDLYVVNNPDIKNVTVHNLTKIFSSSYVGNYQPLSMLTYMAEYHFFKLNPAAYHVTNLLLHVINCVLVFLLIYGLSGSTVTGLLVGLLFAVHPLRVESVTWIAERKDVLSSCFYFLSLLFYVRYGKKGVRRWYWSCATALVFSLLSKPMAVSQPFVLLLIDYLRGRRIDGAAVLNKLPFFGIAAVFSAITLLTQFPGVKTGYLHLPFQQIVLAPFYGIVFYLTKTVVPAHLCAFYPFPATLHVRLLASPVLVIGAAAAVWRFRTRSKKLVFGSLFFLVTALPVLQIVRIGNAIVAERYTYVPMIGIYFAVAALVTFLLEEKFKYNPAAKTALLSGAALLLIVFASITHDRCRVWKDGFSLWNDVVGKIPSETAYTLRGVAFDNAGDYDRAIQNHTMAITFNPNFAEAYYNRGTAYHDKGNYARAIDDYSKAIRIDSSFAFAYSGRGLAYHDIGDYDRAIRDFNEVVRLGLAPAEAYYNRGTAYKAKGENTRAIGDFTEAIRLDPNYSEAYNNRGLAYYAGGDYDRAISDYTEAIKINPSFAMAFTNRGLAWCDEGEYDRAIEEQTRAIALDPAYAPSYCNRGLAYFRKGEYDSAVMDDTRAIRLDPKYTQAYNNRGIACAQRGDYGRALEDISQAIRLSPEKADAWFNRGLVNESKGDHAGALADMKKACALGYGPACAKVKRK